MATLVDRIMLCHKEGMSIDQIMEKCGASRAFVQRTIGDVPNPGAKLVWDEETCRKWNYWRRRALKAMEAGYTLHGRNVW